MSTTVAPPRLHRWVDRLSPAQQRELETIVTNNAKFPPIEDDDAQSRRAAGRSEFLAMAGAIKGSDLPPDYARNSDTYASELAWQKHNQA